MFMNKKLSGVLIAILAVALLSACAAKPTVDPNQKSTEIAATVQAELTKIALLTPSATATLEPTATPTQAPATPTVELTLSSPTPTTRPTFRPGSTGDNAKFAGDVNYPDGEIVKAGQTITKTWQFQNTGTTTWTTDYGIIYLDGNLMGKGGATFFKLPKAVAPGETVEVSAQFTLPTTNGRYTSRWSMYSASGYLFGEWAGIDVTVGTPTGTGTVVPTTVTTP